MQTRNTRGIVRKDTELLFVYDANYLMRKDGKPQQPNSIFCFAVPVCRCRGSAPTPRSR